MVRDQSTWWMAAEVCTFSLIWVASVGFFECFTASITQTLVVHFFSLVVADVAWMPLLSHEAHKVQQCSDYKLFA